MRGNKPDAVAGLEQKPGALVLPGQRRIEQTDRRAADNVPATGTFHRVDARVFTANGDRARGDARSRRGEPRRMQPWVQVPQVRKSRREAEQVNFIDSRAVQFAHLLPCQPVRLRDAPKVRTIIDDRDFLHGHGRQSARRDRAQTGGEVRKSRGVGCPGLELQQDRGEGRHELDQARRRMALQFGGDRPTAGEGFVADAPGELEQPGVRAVRNPVHAGIGLAGYLLKPRSLARTKATRC